MALSREEVLNVAKLARLKFSEKEIEKFQVDLNSILDYIDMLNEVDISGIEPLTNVNKGVNNLREDVVIESLGDIEAVSNAPVSSGGTFIVPKVVGGE
ncbi:MAG: Asp-tRNA(Asn)/Glu-tRNA(Gln) amidotransferase subunit GatC [Fusobacteriaceae bacterium]|jgi:aspartyl-tRNA(Asn)/glutamyl-tRNA(Gln) amidotransferase subunit C|nr:Asp-tRNA(Asn)/Glu-tRNA(Gln) amidotransferase subunit GatC [Fusobacteriaceae bacterium]